MFESPIIVGIVDIADYLRRSKRIVREMIQSNELPVTFQRGAYMTSTFLLNEWIKQKVTDVNDTNR